jgi:hypothetical protein
LEKISAVLISYSSNINEIKKAGVMDLGKYYKRQFEEDYTVKERAELMIQIDEIID